MDASSAMGRDIPGCGPHDSTATFTWCSNIRCLPGQIAAFTCEWGRTGTITGSPRRLRPAGFEIQILDDRAPRYAGLKDYQFGASVYDIAGASRTSRNPPGSGTRSISNVQGMHVTIRHNGVRVVDAEPGPLSSARSCEIAADFWDCKAITEWSASVISTLDRRSNQRRRCMPLG